MRSPSSSVLYTRLSELTEAGLVEQREGGTYALTGLGVRLGSALQPLDEWAQAWSHMTGAQPTAP